MSMRYMYVYMWVFVPRVFAQLLALGSTCPLHPSLPRSRALCSCWQSPIAHRNAHTQTHVHTHTCAYRAHRWLTRAPLAPRSQLLARLPPQKHKNIWSPGHFTSKPGSMFTKAHILTHAFVLPYTFVRNALPPVACTTDTWASGPGSHSSCWHLDPHICTHNRKILRKGIQ